MPLIALSSIYKTIFIENGFTNIVEVCPGLVNILTKLRALGCTVLVLPGKSNNQTEYDWILSNYKYLEENLKNHGINTLITQVAEGIPYPHHPDTLKKTEYFEIDMLDYALLVDDTFFIPNSDELRQVKTLGKPGVYFFDSRNAYVTAAINRGYHHSYQVTPEKNLTALLKEQVEHSFSLNILYLMHQRFMHWSIGNGYRPGQLQDFGCIYRALKKASLGQLKDALTHIPYDEAEEFLYISYRKLLLESDEATLKKYIDQYDSWLVEEKKRMSNYSFWQSPFLSKSSFEEILAILANENISKSAKSAPWYAF